MPQISSFWTWIGLASCAEFCLFYFIFNRWRKWRCRRIVYKTCGCWVGVGSDSLAICSAVKKEMTKRKKKRSGQRKQQSFAAAGDNCCRGAARRNKMSWIFSAKLLIASLSLSFCCTRWQLEFVNDTKTAENLQTVCAKIIRPWTSFLPERVKQQISWLLISFRNLPAHQGRRKVKLNATYSAHLSVQKKRATSSHLIFDISRLQTLLVALPKWNVDHRNQRLRFSFHQQMRSNENVAPNWYRISSEVLQLGNNVMARPVNHVPNVWYFT